MFTYLRLLKLAESPPTHCAVLCARFEVTTGPPVSVSTRSFPLTLAIRQQESSKEDVDHRHMPIWTSPFHISGRQSDHTCHPSLLECCRQQRCQLCPHNPSGMPHWADFSMKQTITCPQNPSGIACLAVHTSMKQTLKQKQGTRKTDK